jgi:hypothetical protein
MSDPHVREIGRLEDDQGRILIVGVDHGAVTLRTLLVRPGRPPAACGVELGCVLAEEFGRLYVAACWEAARDIERLAVALAAAS